MRAQRNIGVSTLLRRDKPMVQAIHVCMNPAPNEIVVPPSSSGGKSLFRSIAPVNKSKAAVFRQNRINCSACSPSKKIRQRKRWKIDENCRSNGQRTTGKQRNFYLLDEDLQSILSDADIEDEKWSGFNQCFRFVNCLSRAWRYKKKKALDAINNIRYKTLTDSTGKSANEGCYSTLITCSGIKKNIKRFCYLESPVTIQPGDNSLAFCRQCLIEIVQ